MKQLLILILAFYFSAAKGEGFNIKVNLPSAASKKVMLTFYYTANIYIKDTVILDKNGVGVFSADTLLHQGLYKIYLDDKNHFDFLLGADQQFSLTNLSFNSKELKAEGAIETEKMQEYLIFFIDIQEKNKSLLEKFQKSEGDEKKDAEKEMNILNQKIQDYWLNVNQKYPNTFFAKFLMANYIPSIDVSKLSENIQKNDSLLRIAKYYYQRSHFWDYFDLNDERMYYTPLIKLKLENWFNNVLVQQYDSIKPFVIDLIEKNRRNRNNFQYLTSWFLNSSITSTLMGMDALFVDLAQKYYLSGQAFWANKESMDKIKENVLFYENNLIGKQGPSITVEDMEGKKVNLYSVNAKITVILVYEPDCSHCKEFVPKFYNEVYLPWRDRGLEVFAIYSMNKKEEWAKFIEANKLHDWLNVWDPNHLSRFKILYDSRTTPAVYVLDRSKKIIGKKLTIEGLKKFMEFELQ